MDPRRRGHRQRDGPEYTAAAADEGERLKVRVAFEDDAGHAESLTSAATDAVAAAPANTPAEGRPEIAGKARVGETLTASTSGISDADGLDNAAFAHQWLRDGADIPGATGAAYTVAEADEGERLKVRVEFTDDAGNDESLTSRSTSRVATRPLPKASMADARVREAAGATLDFAVTLSAPPPGLVTVDYRTLDASATAGEDYEARFHDPGGGSHATFGGRRLWGGGGLFDALPGPGGGPGDPFACSPFGGGLFGAAPDGAPGHGPGGAVTLDGGSPLGGGTDLGHAGRTFGANAGTGFGTNAGIDCGMSGGTNAGMPAGTNGAMGAGMNAGTNRGMNAGTSGGMNPGMNGVMGTGLNGGMGMDGARRGPPTAGGGYRPRLRDLLLGNSFRLSAGGEDEYGAPRRLTAWGGASATRFDGVADGVSVNGEVATFLVGADAAWNRWLAGITVAHSIGAVGFRGGPGGGPGELDSALTAVHPYARWQANDRLSAWGVLGYGTGDLTLGTNGAVWETDTSMRMAAGGLRGVFLRGAGGLEMAAKTDLRVTHIASDGVEDHAVRLLAAAATRRRAPGSTWAARCATRTRRWG